MNVPISGLMVADDAPTLKILVASSSFVNVQEIATMQKKIVDSVNLNKDGNSFIIVG